MKQKNNASPDHMPSVHLYEGDLNTVMIKLHTC